mmetsp:Transcript_7959/g.12195  ORF Transcript_7959/g.12195 Transcript_7959/m.12195 type:complete len:86 (-) Transcript_7959:1305-1562(-)
MNDITLNGIEYGFTNDGVLVSSEGRLRYVGCRDDGVDDGVSDNVDDGFDDNVDEGADDGEKLGVGVSNTVRGTIPDTWKVMERLD